MEQYDIMDHCIGHSKIKTLDYNDLFERKIIIDELEASLSEHQQMLKILKFSVVDVEANADEDITSGAKDSKINKSIDEMEIDLE